MEETLEGPTPAGGVKSVARFYDANMRPAERDKAKNVVITEYDADGKELRRTYGVL